VLRLEKALALWLLLLVVVNLVSCGSDTQRTQVPTDVQKSAHESDSSQDVAREYAGSKTCAQCHQEIYDSWIGSHHQRAMQPADNGSVRGDFTGSQFTLADVTTTFKMLNGHYVVNTDGPDGTLTDFTVRYTFGVAPLQQYLLETGDGHLQALGVSWDDRDKDQGGQRWFHLQPDGLANHNDVLHWTRPSANWNVMCADCHSTGVRKNYDQRTGVYNTTYAEVSVGCEACHGRGAEHVNRALAGSGGPAIVSLATQSAQINSCAQCHSRRSQLAEGFESGANFYDYYMPSLLDAGLYHADGQILDEVYVWGSFAQSKMFTRGVVCSNCHDPHTAELKLQGNTVCTQCHNNSGRPDFPSLPLVDFEDPAHHFHEPGSEGAQCVACHMPATTYMVIDDRRDHSFRIPRPDLTITIGVPNACNQCHDEKSSQWAQTAITQWYGQNRRQHFAPIFAAGRSGEPAAESGLVELAEDNTQPAIVRATAFALLAGYELRRSSAAIEQGLKDPHPLVRIGALRGSLRWGAQLRWQRLKMLLEDEILAVRIEAVRALLNVYPQLAPKTQQLLQPYLQTYLDNLSLHTDTAEGQSNIAAVHSALNNIPAAEAALQQSLVLNPQWVPGMVNLADLYRSTGRDGLGGALLDSALAVSPRDPDVLVAKGLWLVRQGEAGKALPLLEQAWQMATSNPRYAYIYAVALNSTGQAASALAVADKTLALRRDEQLLRTAFAIARDANLQDKMSAYAKALQHR
jgi:predicted CXXCH cytochrome family protein